MDEETKKLINLLKGNADKNTLKDILNIPNAILTRKLNEVEKLGFHIKRTYNSNGLIYYKVLNSLEKIENYRKQNIKLRHDFKTPVNALAISDLHLGNELETRKALYKAFNYCKNHNIHIIFCCGDMIDGTFTRGKQRIRDPYEQIEYLIKEYPSDPDILTIAVGGDHDESILHYYYQDMIEILKQAREDIIIRSYGNLLVDIKEDQILLYHQIPNQEMMPNKVPIILLGHTHQYYLRENHRNQLNIHVPALSGISTKFPSALELSLNFKANKISEVHIKQIGFDTKQPTTISEEDIKLKQHLLPKSYKKKKTLN